LSKAQVFFDKVPSPQVRNKDSDSVSDKGADNGEGPVCFLKVLILLPVLVPVLVLVLVLVSVMSLILVVMKVMR